MPVPRVMMQEVGDRLAEEKTKTTSRTCHVVHECDLGGSSKYSSEVEINNAFNMVAEPGCHPSADMS